MKTLDLEKLYNVLCKVINEQHALEEGGRYYDLFHGQNNFHSGIDFESFVLDYTFSFVPLDIYEHTGVSEIRIHKTTWIGADYSVEEKIYVPVQLLYLSEEDLEEWIENRIKECEVEEGKKKEQEIGIKLAELRNSLLQTKSHEISTSDIIEIITAETEEEFKEIVKKIIK